MNDNKRGMHDCKRGEELIRDLATHADRHREGLLIHGSYATSTRQTHVSFPRFAGDDLSGWLYRSKTFFERDGTPWDRRVMVAVVHLEGQALQWHRVYMMKRMTREPPQWEEYVQALHIRFGATTLEDSKAELLTWRQTGERDECLETFDSLAGWKWSSHARKIHHQFGSATLGFRNGMLVLVKKRAAQALFGISDLCNNDGSTPYNDEPVDALTSLPKHCYRSSGRNCPQASMGVIIPRSDERAKKDVSSLVASIVGTSGVDLAKKHEGADERLSSLQQLSESLCPVVHVLDKLAIIDLTNDYTCQSNPEVGSNRLGEVSGLNPADDLKPDSSPKEPIICYELKVDADEQLVKISSMPNGAQQTFEGMTQLNRVQSKQMALNRNTDGSVNHNSYKIVCVAPMIAVVANGSYSSPVVLDGYPLLTQKAQQRMKTQANKRRSECQFEEVADELMPHLETILQYLLCAYGGYQRQKLRIVYDTMGTLADVVGAEMNMSKFLDTLMPPLVVSRKVWAASLRICLHKANCRIYFCNDVRMMAMMFGKIQQMMGQVATQRHCSSYVSGFQT